MVAGVLVVIDEHLARVAVLAPPDGGGVIGYAALELPGKRQRRPAYVAVAVLGLDPHVDVNPRAARGLRPTDRAELGDLNAGIDEAVFSIEPLLEWADRDGLKDQPPE